MGEIVTVIMGIRVMEMIMVLALMSRVVMVSILKISQSRDGVVVHLITKVMSILRA